MTAERKVRVTCDGPGCEMWVEGPYGETADRARAVLRGQGWTTAPEYRYEPDYCPEHTP